MEVDLFAVQPVMRAEDYLSPQAFTRRLVHYFRQAAERRHPGRPGLIVFPEDIATFLLLADHQMLLTRAKTLKQAFSAIGKRSLIPIMATMLRYQTLNQRRAFFAWGAPRVWKTWYTTMVQLAREYALTVVAGSALVPLNRGTDRTAAFRPQSAQIYNVSFTVGPDGRLLQITRKVNMVPTQEDILSLSGGPLDAAQTLTSLPGTTIPMGTAICYDAFWRAHTDHEPDFINVLDVLDRRGARLVAQPSANPWRWNEPWPLDPRRPARIRRQQWDDEGSLTALGRCTSVEIVINPLLIMDVLDLHFDGQSRILARQGQRVEVLAESAHTQGPQADGVLHAVWDFR